MARYRAFLVFLMLIGLWSIASPVLAQGDSPLVAVLTLEPLEPQAVGTRPTIQATLTGELNRPNPNKVLILYVDGERFRQIRTDDLGLASIRLNRDLPVGEHEIKVVFPGTTAYAPTEASMKLTIRPIQLTVETVPPIPNIAFMIDDRSFLSGPDGLAQIEISEPGLYSLQVLNISDIQVSEDTRVSFARWADSNFEPHRLIEARGDIRLQVGFSTSHRVALSFVDLAENEIDPDRVTSVTFKRSNGSYFTFDDPQSEWLWATRIVRRKEGLEAAPLLYSVETAMVDGTSAVNRYQQRFYVEPEDTWEIQLLLYSVRIQAVDAVFGFNLGSGVALHYPDGRIHELEFGENNDVFQDSLARGNYQVQVKGVMGLAPLTPIALSKDQDVRLKVLSAIDIGIGITSGVTVALGLLLYKRPRILKPLARLVPRSRKPVLQPALQPALAVVQPYIVTARPPLVQPLTDLVTARSGLEATPEPDQEVDTSTLRLPEDDPVTDVFSTFDDQHCAEWFMERYHPEGLRCPRCGSTQARVIRETRRSGLKVYRCSECRRCYNLYSGTPFTGSLLTLRQSTRLLNVNGHNDAQLAQELGLSQKTVHKWRQRLDKAGELLDSEPFVVPAQVLRDHAEKSK